MAQFKIPLSKNGRSILEKYYLKNNNGNVSETPEQFFKKLAKTIALADGKYTHKEIYSKLLKKYNKKDTEFGFIISRNKSFLNQLKRDSNTVRTEESFYQLLASLDFLPNSPLLFNLERKIHQFSASYILPLEDSISGIFNSLSRAASIYQGGAGVGLNFSKLRPKGDSIKGVNGKSSGPVSFMKIFDSVADEISKGGLNRGANALVLSVDHPDIKEFLLAKQQFKFLSSNLFVSVTDSFMLAAEKGQTYFLINPKTGKRVAKENAKDILNLICQSIWKYGNPGILFLSETKTSNPLPRSGALDCVSPTGDVALLDNESCIFGNINLSNMVSDKTINRERIKKSVWVGVHFLDNAIDLCDFFDETSSELSHANRKIGLGVMGFADLLAQLRIKYDSDKALKLAEEIMSFINDQALKASVELALSRGTFSNYKKSSYVKKNIKPRNAVRTAIAPASSISLIAGCSSGIEPLYSVSFKYKMQDTLLTEINPHFIDALKEEGVYSQEIINKVKQQGNLKGLFIPAWIKNIFVTASEVPAEWDVKMQASFQKFCDNGVSKIVSFRPDATVEEVVKSVKLSHKLKCRVFMAYRFGSNYRNAFSFGANHLIETEQSCPVCNIPLVCEATIEVCRKCGYGIID